MDTANLQLVGARGDQIVVLNPRRSMTPDEALLHAAWLVALAEPFASMTFSEVLTAVQNT